MKIEEVIGSRITEVRELQELTQEQLGQRIGKVTGRAWTRQAVHSAEKGERKFTASDLLIVAQALGTTVPRLMTPPLAARDVELQDGVALDRLALASLVFPKASSAGVYDLAQENLRTLVQAVMGQHQYFETVLKTLDNLTDNLTMAAEAKATEEEQTTNNSGGK